MNSTRRTGSEVWAFKNWFFKYPNWVPLVVCLAGAIPSVVNLMVNNGMSVGVRGFGFLALGFNFGVAFCLLLKAISDWKKDRRSGAIDASHKITHNEYVMDECLGQADYKGEYPCCRLADELKNK